MIKSIRFENFYSFKNLTIHLHKNDNILVGINGAGKSNFLKAFRLLKNGVAKTALRDLLLDQWGGFEAICFRDIQERPEPQRVVVEYCFDGDIVRTVEPSFPGDVFYAIRIHKTPGINNYYLSERLYVACGRQSGADDFDLIEFHNGKGRVFGKTFFPDDADGNKGSYETRLQDYPDHDPQELVLSTLTDAERFPYQSLVKQAVHDIVAYEYFQTTPYSRIRKPMAPTSEKRLLPDGSNLPQILNTLNINFKKHYREILTALQDVNGHYRSLDFNFLGGNIELMLDEHGLGSAIHVTNISDGTLRFLCLLSIFHNPEKGRVVCIDEPETGLHPDMILTIVQAMRANSEATQYIIATHSENILNAYDLEHLRVFEKNDRNETIVADYAEKDFEGWYDEYVPVGKRWRQGDVGGNRW